MQQPELPLNAFSILGLVEFSIRYMQYTEPQSHIIGEIALLYVSTSHTMRHLHEYISALLEYTTTFVAAPSTGSTSSEFAAHHMT